MLKTNVKCENLTKHDIVYRASLRGLKKCTSCGYINGQRALICRNVNCDLRMKRLAAIKPFDPIQLVTYGKTKLYSLRSKEKLLHPRVFVSITETQGTVESRSCAVCYVDNCKHDDIDSTHHLVCRHIKACKVLTDVPEAEVYPIDKSILWNLNVSIEQKQHLWDLYQLEEKIIHPVQKLNSSIFVVKCVESKIFPAGRLHVTVFSNKVSNKSGSFSCSCKKLKIMLDSDNTVVMKQEICDHMLLLLSAILNKPEGKTLYAKFLDSLQHLWMPTCLNTQIVNYDLSLDKCSKATCIKVANTEEGDNSEDIFNFSEEILVENSIPDFPETILNISNDKISSIQDLSKPKQSKKHEMHIKDPKLNATTAIVNDEEMVLCFPRFDTPDSSRISLYVANTQPSILPNANGLNVIEQYQLNHNVQIPNDSIELAKDIESLNNLEADVMDKHTLLLPSVFKTNSLLKTSFSNDNYKEFTTKQSTIMRPSANLNTYPVQTSVVLKQGSLNIIKIAKPIKNMPLERDNKIIQMSNIDTMITNQYVDPAKQAVNDGYVAQQNKEVSSIPSPSLSYESWLDYVIESLNEKVKVQDYPSVESTFHVPETMFNHFSKSFTLNSNRRLPNKTTLVRNEKYKDHIKYTWYFIQASMVQKVFKSKNMTIELERSYQRLADGNYELYRPITTTPASKNNLRTIYPKVQLYKVFIVFNNTTKLCSNSLQPHKCGLKLEWLPSAFPKSNFGLMTIQFSVSIKQPDGTV